MSDFLLEYLPVVILHGRAGPLLWSSWPNLQAVFTMRGKSAHWIGN